MNNIKTPKIFKKTAIFEHLASKWELVETLSGGTDSMRDAGRKYLKQNPKESNDKYLDRLSRATLTNKYLRTIEKGVGKAFARSMNISVPEILNPLLLNTDGQGTSFVSFSKQLLHDTINYGIMYVLIDVPQTNITTLEEFRQTNVTPYLVTINPTQILDLSVEYIDNALQLTDFRYYENIVQYNDSTLQSETIERVRRYALIDGQVHWEIWQKDDKGMEYVVEKGIMSITQIPIVPIYGKKLQPYIGEPVLMELAHLNVKHWWKQSDLDWNEHYGLTPILALKGIETNPDPTTGQSSMTDFTVGASTAIAMPENGGLSWTTADSNGIKAGQDSLDRLMKEMSEAGLELTTRQEGGMETATGRMLDASESNSILKGIITDLNWQLYQCLVMACEYMGVDGTDIDVAIDTTYTTSSISFTQDLTLLKELFKDGIITLKEMRLELQARKLFISEIVDEGLSNIPQ